MENNLTSGNLFTTMRKFAVPYLIASFLQTFYGMADLFITGQYNGADVVTAVSVGSQIMHMTTVIIVGLSMGTTVSISHAIGEGNDKKVSRFIGNSISVFAVFAIILTILTLLCKNGILLILQTPTESLAEAAKYLTICFAGIPFITAYNVISSIFRGLGDTKRPMIFVGIAGIINIVLDFLLIGPFSMGASGAAFATVLSQAISVCMALFAIRKLSIAPIKKKDLLFDKLYTGKLLNIGTPIAFQDGFIQISFLVITMIANSRGLAIAAAVGIVEKIISFLFLVPSAMLSTVSAIAAQNAGAGNHERGKTVLKYGVFTCLSFGAIVFLICQLIPAQIIALFVKNEPEVVLFGTQYLRSYSLDCAIAGVHFCFSGYFSAYGKSMYSFIHNLASVILVRIPGTYLTSILFPATLYPMGLAAPLGSLFSVLICLWFYHRLQKQMITHK